MARGWLEVLVLVEAAKEGGTARTYGKEERVTFLNPSATKHTFNSDFVGLAGISMGGLVTGGKLTIILHH